MRARLTGMMVVLSSFLALVACGHQCEGDARSCEGRQQSQCVSGAGCAWREGCALSTRCESFSNEANCNDAAPCTWQADRCLFVRNPCFRLTQTACGATPDCTWGGPPACYGNVVPCESHDEENSCVVDPRCTWESVGLQFG